MSQTRTTTTCVSSYRCSHAQSICRRWRAQSSPPPHSMHRRTSELSCRDITAYYGPLRVRCGRARGGYRHGLEFEPEVADAREHTVQLSLIGDLAEELRAAVPWSERQAVEGESESLAQPPAYRDPNPQGRFHLVGRIRAACVRTHHAAAVSPRAIRVGGPVRLQSSVRGRRPS